jgi:hypothetical protein
VLTAYINHSCWPNARLRCDDDDEVVLVATEDIAAGR